MEISLLVFTKLVQTQIFYAYRCRVQLIFKVILALKCRFNILRGLLEDPLREPHYGSLFRFHDVTDSNVVSYEGSGDTNRSSWLRDSIGGERRWVDDRMKGG